MIDGVLYLIHREHTAKHHLVRRNGDKLGRGLASGSSRHDVLSAPEIEGVLRESPTDYTGPCWVADIGAERRGIEVGSR